MSRAIEIRPFEIRAQDFEPAYLKLYRTGELHKRAEEALKRLESCMVCPRNCEVNRLENKTAVCKTGRYALVSSAFPHFGEEDCLRGWNGSGTIFFSMCNLRCVFCIGPDGYILTDRGIQRIEDIFLSSGQEITLNGGKIRFQQGLLVYTRKGKLVPVAKAFCHPYRGEMVVIKPYGLPPLVVTPNHPVFAALRPGSEAQKVPAEALTRAHLLVVPKLRPVESPVELDARALLQPHVTTFRRSVRRRVPISALREMAGVGASRKSTSRQIGERFGYHPAYLRMLLSRMRKGEIEEDGEFIRNDLVEEGNRIRFETEKGPGVPACLPLDVDLARLLGYYCAEGHITASKGRPNSYRLIFSYGRHEAELAERTRALLRKVFGVEATLRLRRTTLTVEAGSASLALLFRHLCGRTAREKQVPGMLLTASDAIVRAFLESYWEGDGCRESAHVSAGTVSRDLALGLVALLLRIGVFPYFYATPLKAHQTIEGRTVNQSETLYCVKCRREAWEGIPPGKRVRYRETPEAFLVPIRRISRIQYEGPVYNLEVADEDHSYVADGVAVSNCQNYDISQTGEGREVGPERLAKMMIELQDRGCHNINFVTPEHVVPQILEAIPIAVEMGLRLPFVYNTSAYDSLDSLSLMDGIVDIYMPDFKFWDPEMAKKYVKAKDYPEAARAAIKEMYRQVGDLVFDENGLAKRGLLVRHLIMPGGIAGTREIMRFLAQEVSIHTYVNIMDQYYPAGVVSGEKYAEINRHITREEYQEAVRIAREEGLYRFDTRRPLIRRPWWS